MREPTPLIDKRLYIVCEHCSWLIPTGELHECEICGKEHTADDTWPKEAA